MGTARTNMDTMSTEGVTMAANTKMIRTAIRHPLQDRFGAHDPDEVQQNEGRPASQSFDAYRDHEAWVTKLTYGHRC